MTTMLNPFTIDWSTLQTNASNIAKFDSSSRFDDTSKEVVKCEYFYKLYPTKATY